MRGVKQLSLTYASVTALKEETSCRLASFRCHQINANRGPVISAQFTDDTTTAGQKLAKNSRVLRGYRTRGILISRERQTFPGKRRVIARDTRERKTGDSFVEETIPLPYLR